MDRNSSLYKTILLGVVCAAAGLLLSAVNALTAPVIAENAIAAVKSSLQEIYPDVTDFSDVTEDYISLDETGLVDEIYQAADQGYIFTLHNTGYDSGGFKFMIGFNVDGTVSGYKGLEHNETSGKGSLAFDEDYANQVMSLTSSDAMPLISGATITTEAVGEAVTAAEKVFNAIVGISADLDNAVPATVSSTIGSADYSSLNASCEALGDGVYACEALGYMGIEYGSGTNTATITIKDGKVESVTDFDGADNKDGIGDDVFEDSYLENYVGADLDSDVQTGATASFSEDSLKAMIQAALNMEGGDASTETASASLGSADYTEYKASCEDKGDGVYACEALGYMGLEYGAAANTATVTVKDGKVESITDFDGGDNKDGVGDDVFEDSYLANYTGADLDSDIQTGATASFSEDSLKAMVQAALKAAAGE